jgi:CO/xanthine dehydrogenase Mo-binding subunit
MVAVQAVGKPTGRVEGVEKVTGRARYTFDIPMAGVLWAKCLLSPHPHARIVGIDTSEAKALPGVYAVLTGEDVAEAGLYGSTLRDMPILARGRVRFAGERVAAVAAIDEDTALQALNLIDVEYEVLPAVFDIEEAMEPGAPILHPDFNAYGGVRPLDAPPTPFAGPKALATPSNAYARNRIDRGDVDKGFAEADVVVENVYHSQRVHQGYLEPVNCTVRINEDGSVDAWAGSKAPYRTRDGLAHTVGLSSEDIVVHHAYIGGDFGAKGTPVALPICYYLAKATGRPVRMLFDYLEEFMAGNPRHATTVTLRTGVKKDGTLTAHHVQFNVNCGAYAAYKPFGTIFGPTQAAGAYRLPNCRIESAHVYTNTIPGGYMRAPGEVQAFWALESQMDEVARAIGMDPLQFRLKNLIDEGEPMPAGEPFEEIRVKETLQAAIDVSGYGKPKARFIGRGIAIGERPPGGGEGNASVTLRPDGTALIGTPIFDQGTGVYTLMRQIVAEELQLPQERVEVEIWPTGVVASDSGVAGSWATRVNTVAAHDATQAAKTELLKLAAERLHWPEDRLSLRGEEIWNSQLEESVRWQDLLSRENESVTGRTHTMEMRRSPVTGFSAQVAEVEVDAETGEFKLLTLTTAHDVGRVINPLAHQGQINGAVVQGLGQAVMEDLRLEDGRVTNLSFGDYKLPTTRDLPELRTALVESPHSGVGPYNIKGIGEPPIGPVAPAIANAIEDAIGVRIRDLPITSEKVYEALKSRRGD